MLLETAKDISRRNSSMVKAEPVVFKKNGKSRRGKGFSREELKKAGLGFREALKLGVPTDSRRRTLHEENVKDVKSFLKGKKTKPKSKGKSKR
jgi:large subunit ribosomal protein L13e